MWTRTLNFFGANITLEFERLRYYKIIGAHTKEVIGVCTEDDKSGILLAEPGTTFARISFKEFLEYGEDDV